jgi:ATP-dependent RNA circularization protein (DNA/RNA ligase family)
VEREEFLSGEIVVEEKLDGANVGLSVTTEGVTRAQNRGAYIQQPSAPQFQPLWHWLAGRAPCLAKKLDPRLVVFGEWCFASHSVVYNRLTDWFIGFDVYDSRAQRFWSSERRNSLLESLGIQVVPEISRGRFDVERLRRLLMSTKSAYGDEVVEGLYLRRESCGWVAARAKVVRPDFIQAIEQHWSGRPLKKNIIVH